MARGETSSLASRVRGSWRLSARVPTTGKAPASRTPCTASPRLRVPWPRTPPLATGRLMCRAGSTRGIRAVGTGATWWECTTLTPPRVWHRSRAGGDASNTPTPTSSSTWISSWSISTRRCVLSLRQALQTMTVRTSQPIWWACLCCCGQEIKTEVSRRITPGAWLVCFANSLSMSPSRSWQARATGASLRGCGWLCECGWGCNWLAKVVYTFANVCVSVYAFARAWLQRNACTRTRARTDRHARTHTHTHTHTHTYTHTHIHTHTHTHREMASRNHAGGGTPKPRATEAR